MKSKRIRVIAAGLVMAAGTCIAGEVHIRAISLTPGYPRGEVHVQDSEGKEKSAKLDVKSFLNHEFQTIDFDSTSLVFTSDGDPASVKDEAKILGRVELPGQLKSGILLFRPGSKDEAPSAMITDDSAKTFPPGSTRVVNLGPDPIRIELEGKKFDCGGKSEIVIKDPPVQKNNSSGMHAFRKKGDEWIQVKSGVWPHPGKKRVLKVILLNPITKRIEIYGVRDISDPTD